MTLRVAALLCLLAVHFNACCSAGMNGPVRAARSGDVAPAPVETSAARIVFLGAIDLYRAFVSPTTGTRCGFYPSCSAFGRQAVSEYGAIHGIMMTGDRLTRCNIFKEPGPDYLLLPSGRLFDPVSANTLSKQGAAP